MGGPLTAIELSECPAYAPTEPVRGPPTAIELSECPAYAPTESVRGQRRVEDRIYDN